MLSFKVLLCYKEANKVRKLNVVYSTFPTYLFQVILRILTDLRESKFTFKSLVKEESIYFYFFFVFFSLVNAFYGKHFWQRSLKIFQCISHLLHERIKRIIYVSKLFFVASLLEDFTELIIRDLSVVIFIEDNEISI